ncbi:MAG TPA: hypothetical protein DCE39_12105 [Planctomycetaceae bacterium]|nr:hypothetical protein [Planctomycetaceae bacterium]
MLIGPYDPGLGFVEFREARLAQTVENVLDQGRRGDAGSRKELAKKDRQKTVGAVSLGNQVPIKILVGMSLDEARDKRRRCVEEIGTSPGGFVDDRVTGKQDESTLAIDVNRNQLLC